MDQPQHDKSEQRFQVQDLPSPHPKRALGDSECLSYKRPKLAEGSTSQVCLDEKSSCTDDDTAPAITVKRKQASIDTKLRAIAEIEKALKSKSDIAKDFGITLGTLQAWQKRKDELQISQANRRSSLKERTSSQMSLEKMLTRPDKSLAPDKPEPTAKPTATLSAGIPQKEGTSSQMSLVKPLIRTNESLASDKPETTAKPTATLTAGIAQKGGTASQMSLHKPLFRTYANLAPDKPETTAKPTATLGAEIPQNVKDSYRPNDVPDELSLTSVSHRVGQTINLVKSLEVTIQAKDEELEELKAKVVKLKSTLKCRKESLRSKDQAITSLQAEAEKKLHKWEASMLVKEQNIVTVNAQLNEAQNEIERVKKESAQKIQLAIDEKEALMKSLHRDIQEKVLDFDAKKKEIQEWQAHAYRLREERDKAQEQMDTMKSEQASSRQESEGFASVNKSQLVAKDSELARLKEELCWAKSSLEADNAQNKKLQIELQSNNAQMFQMESELAKAKTTVNGSIAEIERLKRLILEARPPSGEGSSRSTGQGEILQTAFRVKNEDIKSMLQSSTGTHPHQPELHFMENKDQVSEEIVRHTQMLMKQEMDREVARFNRGPDTNRVHSIAGKGASREEYGNTLVENPHETVPGSMSDSTNPVIWCVNLEWKDQNPIFTSAVKDFLQSVKDSLLTTGRIFCSITHKPENEIPTVAQRPLSKPILMVVPCLVTSLVHSCISGALDQIKALVPHRRLLVMYHPREEQDKVVTSTRQLLGTAQVPLCDLIVDVVFDRRTGLIYKDAANAKAIEEIVAHLNNDFTC